MKEHWTRAKDAKLRKLYRTSRAADIARLMGITRSAVRNRVQNLKLRRNLFHRLWTRSEHKKLRAIYPDRHTVDVAKILKRTVCSINGQAAKFRLHKSAAYMSGILKAEADRLRVAGVPHRFRPGQVPANKGLHRPGYSLTHGRMAQTTFKKGQRTGAANSNWRPIGTVALNADGYLIRKIADKPNAGIGATNRNWELVHKRVWQDAHGPIPKGHRIWWKDKNHANCALENLELLSDKEHMARTTIHRLPAELKDTIMLAGRLKRIIRRKTREAIEEGLHGEQHHGTAQASV